MLRVLAVVMAAMLGLCLLALAVVPWQQNVTGQGRVVAFEPFDRQQTIAAPVSGRVRKAWVIEGSKVEEGDKLLEIVDNDPSILQRLREQRDALVAQLEASEQKATVYQAQIEALGDARGLAMESAQSQVDVATADLESARYALDAAVAAQEQARLNFDRQRDLVDEGLTSELDFEVADRLYKEARARAEQARQALQAALNEQRARRAELGQVTTEAQARIEVARAAFQTAQVEVSDKRARLSALEVRIAQQNTQLITAPRKGTVFRLFAAPGAELVRAGDPLLVLIPETASRAVELWVDGNDVPLVEEGRVVRLQFEGWPAVQFSGWPSVAVGTFGGRVAFVDPSDDGRGSFRLVVVPDDAEEPWPAPEYLRQGVRANGFVLLDRVSIGYELWRQLNGFPPTVALRNEASALRAGGAG